MRTIFDQVDSDIFICSNGLISRSAYLNARPKADFYMLGSMGLAASIAIGVAIAKPFCRIGVLEGDGNILMNPVGLLMIGTHNSARITHICFNNRSYESTGGQKTIGHQGIFADLARASGYGRVEIAATDDELRSFCRHAKEAKEATFCEVLVTSSNVGSPDRVPLSCEQIALRVRESLSTLAPLGTRAG